MPVIELSRQEAEIGLLPSLCAVCGSRLATTRGVHFHARGGDDSTLQRTGVTGLFARSLGWSSMTVLLPLCHDHQARPTAGRDGIRAIRVSSHGIVLDNVSAELVAALERMRGRAPVNVSQPPARATPAGAGQAAAQPTEQAPIDDLTTAEDPEAAEVRRPRAASLAALAVMSALILPLVACFGMLMVPMFRGPWRPPQAHRQRALERQERFRRDAQRQMDEWRLRAQQRGAEIERQPEPPAE